MNDEERAALRKKAGMFLRKRDFYMAAYCRELAGDMYLAADLYLKDGDWDKASHLYFSLGLTKLSYEIDERGRRGEYK
jgi:hypothetical protein